MNGGISVLGEGGGDVFRLLSLCCRLSLLQNTHVTGQRSSKSFACEFTVHNAVRKLVLRMTAAHAKSHHPVALVP